MGGLLGFGFVPELFILGVVLGAIVMFVVLVRRRAKRFGYPSTRRLPARGAPLRRGETGRGRPRAEGPGVLRARAASSRRSSWSGSVPLFYGGRKLVYASMGLGLVDDADQPGA